MTLSLENLTKDDGMESLAYYPNMKKLMLIRQEYEHDFLPNQTAIYILDMQNQSAWTLG